MNTMDYYLCHPGWPELFFPPLRIVCTSHCISSSCICVQMYTTLLMLSSFLFSLARIHDWHLITQSLKTSHLGAVHVLLLPGLLMASGQRVPCHQRYPLHLYRRNGRGAVWTLYWFDEWHSLFGWLVKRFGTRKVIRTTMSCAVIGMAILSVALWLHSAWLFRIWSGRVWRQFWRSRSGHQRRRCGG